MTQTWNYWKYLSHNSHKPLRQTQTVHSNHTYSKDNECIYVFKQSSATYSVCSSGIITSLRKLNLIWHNFFLSGNWHSSKGVFGVSLYFTAITRNSNSPKRTSFCILLPAQVWHVNHKIRDYVNSLELNYVFCKEC